MEFRIIMTLAYKHHLYAVALAPAGHYCGYVQCNDSEKNVFNNAYHEHLAEHYCGITFATHIKQGGFLPEGNWIGFDTAHAGNKKDIDMVRKIFGNTAAENIHQYSDEIKRVTPRSTERECKKLINHIIELQKREE